ncbi:MAG: AAA family ATPase [Cytophagales bacterium]|nr:MAG: AAA family ATPase [Cytophagales bacterium]
MQNLPLGKQEFSTIRESGDTYIDKTKLIHKLLIEGKYYFFSRPRRFGKSLLVNTIKEIFLGNKHYFKGLWIETHWNFEPYPVIKIDFGAAGHKEIGTENAIRLMLDEVAENHSIILESNGIGLKLRELIVKMSAEKQVVLLIDEYDKPIIDYLEDAGKATENREILKNLYSAIKPLDAHLKFVFLTGVSKFSKVGIFSDLNNISDITLAPDFTTIVGYTQEELEFYFDERIDNLCITFNKSKAQLLDEIRKRYNGYSWDAQNFVYNPYSILSFFQHKKFDNYWFSTGTPTFLTKLLKKGFHYELKNINVGHASFDSSDLKNLDYVSVLFQTGYLTIKEDVGFEMYRLDFPNTEVRDAFNQFLLVEYADLQPTRMQPLVFNLYNALKSTNFEEVRIIFNALFAAIPRDYFLENREKFYHAICFLTLRLLGYFTQIEINSGRERLDCIVFLENKVFLFEFKLDQSSQRAMEQIKERNYFAPYLGQGKEIYLIGVNMMSEHKEIEDFLIEQP